MARHSGAWFETGGQVPYRGFQSAGRHAMPAHVPGESSHGLGAVEYRPDHAWSEVVAQQQPRGVGPFFVVEGMLAAGRPRPIR